MPHIRCQAAVRLPGKRWPSRLSSFFPQVPEEAASAPVPTRAQLTDQFADVARLSRELSLLPEGQGGMLSVAVAKLAAKLKVCAMWLAAGCLDLEWFKWPGLAAPPLVARAAHCPLPAPALDTRHRSRSAARWQLQSLAMASTATWQQRSSGCLTASCCLLPPSCSLRWRAPRPRRSWQPGCAPCGCGRWRSSRRRCWRRTQQQRRPASRERRFGARG